MIRDATPVLAPVCRPLDASVLGLVTSADVIAAADTPRFACSAMDGFAVPSHVLTSASDAHPVTLTMAPEIPAQGPSAMLREDMAAPISTGAPLPAGADAVVAGEKCLVADRAVSFSSPVEPGRNVRRQAEEIGVGAVALEAGCVLTPEAIGALRSYGVSSIWARPLPTIRILTTGSEISFAQAMVSDRLDCNGPMLAAACHRLGLICHQDSPVPDDEQALHRELVGREVGEDILITTGGVSVGRHDLVRKVVEAAGADILFHGIAMRPGKPLMFARLPDGRLLFCLPGNPAAALVGFRFFVIAALRQMVGLRPEAAPTLSQPVEARPGTTLFLRAKRRPDASGEVTILEDQRSHVLRSVLQADCWVRTDASGDPMAARFYDLAPHLA